MIVAAEHATRLFPMLTTAAGKAQMPRFVDANGKGTNDEKAAAKDPKSGKPADNPARNRRCRPRSTPPTSRRARPPS